jgi:hypothetical protein
VLIGLLSGSVFRAGTVDTHMQQQSFLRFIKQRVDSWQDCNLSLHGRVLCLNVFVLSQLWFAAHVVPLEQKVLQAVDAVTRRFLWNGSHPRVKLELVQQSRDKGGLGLMPTNIQARALLAKWFVRVLNLDGLLWYVLEYSLLFRHLATARRTLSDLLAGNVSS